MPLLAKYAVRARDEDEYLDQICGLLLALDSIRQKAAEMRRFLHLESDVSKITLEEAGRPGDDAWKDVGTPSPLFKKIEREAD